MSSSLFLSQSDNHTKANATNKLTVIAEQMRYLQEQAKKVGTALIREVQA